MTINQLKTNARLTELRDALFSAGITQESFIFWARESMDPKYIESLPYYKLMILAASLTLKFPISNELAAVLIESGCSVTENLYGYVGKTPRNMKTVKYSEASKEVLNDPKTQYFLIVR